MTNPTFSRRSFLGTATGAAALAALPGGAFAKDILRMSTLGPGTSPNLVMTTFASIVNGALPDYEIQLNATGAATRHVLEVAMGRSDFCMSSPAIHALMRRQAAMYEKIEQAPELVNNLRTVLNFPMGVYHIAVYDSSGITSIDQIAGKRVFLGPPEARPTPRWHVCSKPWPGWKRALITKPSNSAGTRPRRRSKTATSTCTVIPPMPPAPR